jgi:hypothetical protein
VGRASIAMKARRGTIAAKKQRNRQVQIASNDPRVSRAIFTLREAAGYLGIPNSTLHQGARGSAADLGPPPRWRSVQSRTPRVHSPVERASRAKHV